MAVRHTVTYTYINHILDESGLHVVLNLKFCAARCCTGLQTGEMLTIPYSFFNTNGLQMLLSLRMLSKNICKVP